MRALAWKAGDKIAGCGMSIWAKKAIEDLNWNRVNRGEELYGDGHIGFSYYRQVAKNYLSQFGDVKTVYVDTELNNCRDVTDIIDSLLSEEAHKNDKSIELIAENHSGCVIKNRFGKVEIRYSNAGKGNRVDKRRIRKLQEIASRC